MLKRYFINKMSFYLFYIFIVMIDKMNWIPDRLFGVGTLCGEVSLFKRKCQGNYCWVEVIGYYGSKTWLPQSTTVPISSLICCEISIKIIKRFLFTICCCYFWFDKTKGTLVSIRSAVRQLPLSKGFHSFVIFEPGF